MNQYQDSANQRLAKGELVYGGRVAELARNPKIHIRHLGV